VKISITLVISAIWPLLMKKKKLTCKQLKRNISAKTLQTQISVSQ